MCFLPCKPPSPVKVLYCQGLRTKPQKALAAERGICDGFSVIVTINTAGSRTTWSKQTSDHACVDVSRLDGGRELQDWSDGVNKEGASPPPTPPPVFLPACVTPVMELVLELWFKISFSLLKSQLLLVALSQPQ